ncbi:L-2-hydroxyglutarate oxidase [Neisseriaceae bacterium CLB008]
MNKPNYAIVGGGINGLAVARQILIDHPEAQVTLFEKESQVAAHQSSHNSGVVHAGLYYEPGSLKAKLCRRGVTLVKNYCLEHDLPYEECGKLVVALTEDELPRLDAIYQKSLANNVPGVKMLYGDEIRTVEPNCIGVAALHSPETAIVSYGQIAEHIASELIRQGAVIELNSPVAKIEQGSSHITLTLANGRVYDRLFDYVVTCAGLQSDRLAANSGDSATPKIIPFFGQYYVVEEAYKHDVKGLIYPVPDPKYPFLGVHFTKRIDGEMTLGPNAFISKGRECYDGKKINFGDVFDYLGYRGFWRFARKNIPAAIREMKTVFSQRNFVSEAAKYVPSLAHVKVSPATRGIRAQAMQPDGSLVDDFVINKQGNITHIRNAPSPGATSSLAIAEYIVREVMQP